MRSKILVWTGVGIIVFTLGLLFYWAFYAGLLPRIEIHPEGLVVIPPRLDLKAINLLDLFAHTAIVPLKMLMVTVQTVLQQFVDAFRFPQ
jgi:hypothetical protein